MRKINLVPSSFKDPSGFVFLKNNRIFRQINPIYQKNYEFFMQSGLYGKLVETEALIPHKEIERNKIIEPQLIPFISYPYEWCFDELKDAALLTLWIQKISLAYGMSLKDASSFNIQFLAGKPIFIDTLSFEKYEEGKPWVAYKQFCEQFLAPLALFAYRDIRLGKMLQDDAGIIPLDLAVKLLPLRAKLRPSLFLHLILHARSQKKYEGVALKQKSSDNLMSRPAFQELITVLEETIESLSWPTQKTIWTSYGRQNPSYTDQAFEKKKILVAKYLEITKPKTLWDIGANTGVFTRMAANKGIFTISMDNDHSVVEQNYQTVKRNREKNILPLWIDIANPTPSVGWEARERDSLFLRPHPDTVMALALIHHLVMVNNLSFPLLAGFFAKICVFLIIEFVPKDDPQTQVLLQNREDIFMDYNQETFEKEFTKFFHLKEKAALPGSKRSLYLMENNKRKT